MHIQTEAHWSVLHRLSNTSILLQEGDEETGEALHHADLQFGNGDQLVKQFDKEHMVLFAELSSI